jgi:vitamin-K-epoxide reductase (warfarin-sensitive)
MPTAVTVMMPRLMNVVAILSLSGVVVSAVSLQHHYASSKTAYCDLGQMFNCDIVNRSEYSSILGVPVALIGMIGYAGLAGLSIAYRRRRETPSILVAMAGAGLIFALYLTYIEGHVLGVWCILCLTSLALIATTTFMTAVIRWSARNE